MQQKPKTFRTTSTSTEPTNTTRGSVCYNCDVHAAVRRLSPPDDANLGSGGLRYSKESLSTGAVARSSSTKTDPANSPNDKSDKSRKLSHALATRPLPPPPKPPNRCLMVASTSIDLIDLSDSQAERRATGNADRYSNFNPGYKSTTPPDDVSVTYPTPGVPVSVPVGTSFLDTPQKSLPILHEVVEGPQCVSVRARPGRACRSASQLELAHTEVWETRASWAGPSLSPSPSPSPPIPPTVRNLPGHTSSPPRSPRSSAESSSSPSPRSPRHFDDPLGTPPRSPKVKASSSGTFKYKPQGWRTPGSNTPTPPQPPEAWGADSADPPQDPVANVFSRQPPPLDCCEADSHFYWELEFPAHRERSPSAPEATSIPLGPIPRKSSSNTFTPVQTSYPLSHSSSSSPKLSNATVMSSVQSIPTKKASVRVLQKSGSAMNIPYSHSAVVSSQSGDVWEPQPGRTIGDSAAEKPSPAQPRSDCSKASSKSGPSKVACRSRKGSRRSQSCEQLSGKKEGKDRSARHRCPTPPRVLSPSLETMQCEMMGDI